MMSKRWEQWNHLLEKLVRFDGNLLLKLQRWRTPNRTKWMTMITHLGDGGAVWFGISGILLLFKKTRNAGCAALRGLVYTFVVVNLLMKNLFSRLRPYETVEGLRLLVRRVKDFSFPSGHSASSVAAATAMGKLLPKRFRIFPHLLAGMICFSRVYVGIHFPSDVLCGVLTGWLCGHAAVKKTADKQ